MPKITGGITFGPKMTEEDKQKYRKALGRDGKRDGLELMKRMVRGEVVEGKPGSKKKVEAQEE